MLEKPMLLRLRDPLTESERDSIFSLCKELGYSYQFRAGSKELLELTGAGAPSHRSLFEDLTGILSVVDNGQARELNMRSVGGPDLVVEVAGARFGGEWAGLIAGPCAVERADRLQSIAERVQAAGACVLRGGAYKPRTSPYSFRGLGEAGLAMLAETRTKTGLPIVTEVLDPRDVETVGAVTDIFQVGSRSMANAALLTELGKANKPVLLKRGMSATVREFLLAAEYVLMGGNEQVLLCERGVRSFDNVTRNLLDVGAIAHLKRVTHLPVLADPSHAAGRRDLVRALARASMAAGADGLIIEVHPDPGEVHSDGAQAVSFEEFERISADARAILELDGRRLSQADVVPRSDSTSGAGAQKSRPSLKVD